MRIHHLAGLAALIVIAASTPPDTVLAQTSNDLQCSVAAYTNDPDPSGTNVRSKPSVDAKVIATLPQTVEVNGDAFRPELTVTDYQDGWFHIRQVMTGDYNGEGAKLLFGEPGWIAANLVSLEIEASVLHQQPDFDSPALFSLQVDEEPPEAVQVKKLHNCSGGFVDVSVRRADGMVGRGWTNDTCANQATTCS